MFCAIIQSATKEFDDLVPDQSLKNFFEQIAAHYDELFISEEKVILKIVQGLGSLDARLALFVYELSDESTQVIDKNFKIDNELAVKHQGSTSPQKITPQWKQVITHVLEHLRGLGKECFLKARKPIIEATDSVIAMEAYGYFLKSSTSDYGENKDIPKHYFSKSLNVIDTLITTDLQTDLETKQTDGFKAFKECFLAARVKKVEEEVKNILAQHK